MIKSNLLSLLQEHFSDKNITKERLEQIFLGSLRPAELLNSLSEAFRVPYQEIEKFLMDFGFNELVSQARLSQVKSEPEKEPAQEEYALRENDLLSPFPELFDIECSPRLTQKINLPKGLFGSLLMARQNIQASAASDSFFKMYCQGVMAYHDSFVAGDGRLINQYLRDNFPGNFPYYVISTGIGANEMFCHFMAEIYNRQPQKTSEWLVFDSPLHLKKLPQDARLDNTLFLEFCRSGKTQETVKIHEFTSRSAKRIVFTNTGPMAELAKRDNNLLLELPDAIPGRFGRNLTPFLLAPLFVLRQDTRKIWSDIETAIERFNPGLSSSLPLSLAEFIYVHQLLNQINHGYLGCSGDSALLSSADELVQLWNEGVAKKGNDLLLSRYLGQPRDSHTVVEGILANAKTKLAIFLICQSNYSLGLSELVLKEVDPINSNHAGLKYGEDDLLLAQANYERFKELMPVIKIKLKGELSFSHAIVLGQLWQDLVACYAKIKGIDPGSNPEVRAIRDRSEQILSEWNENI